MAGRANIASVLIIAAVFAGASVGAEDPTSAAATTRYKSVPWDLVYAQPARRVLRIFVTYGGGQYPVRVRLRETPSRITVDLLARDTGRPGTDDARTECVEVRLDRRAGERDVYDRGHKRRKSGPDFGPVDVSGDDSGCRRLRRA